MEKLENGDFVMSPINNGYLTKNKKYKVYNCDGVGFMITDDDDCQLVCLIKGDMHIKSKKWIIVKNK